MKNLVIKKKYFICTILTAFLIIFVFGHRKIFAATDGKVNLELWTLTLDDDKKIGTLTNYKCDDSLKDIIVPNAADFIKNSPAKYKNLTKVYITKKVMQKALLNANKESGTLKISDNGIGEQQTVFAQDEDWALMTVVFGEDLKLISKIDFSNFNTSNVTNMCGMFKGCSNLASLTLIKNFDTSQVINMAGMFAMCKNLTSLDLGSNFDTQNVTNMVQMFNCCESLHSLTFGENFDTRKVTNMYSMFSDCKSLEILVLGENFNTSNVKDMSFMFSGCNHLVSLVLGENFNTSNVENMNGMFRDCTELKSLHFGKSFNTSNVKFMASMFGRCVNLKSLHFGKSFDTSSVEDMNHMFNGCAALKELFFSENFDTSKVTNMQNMFGNCRTLKTLDLSLFNTENVKHMANMFRNCANLETLVLGYNFTTSKLEAPPAFMFNGCTSLKEICLIFDNNNVSNSNTNKIAALCAVLTLKDLPGGQQQLSYLKILKGYRKGFLFENWYEDEALTKTFNFDNDTFTVDNILYAKWKRIPGTSNLDFDDKQKIKTKENLDKILNDMVNEGNNNLKVIERVKETLFEKY